jgi:hypothetical protein
MVAAREVRGLIACANTAHRLCQNSTNFSKKTEMTGFSSIRKIQTYGIYVVNLAYIILLTIIFRARNGPDSPVISST